MSMYIILSSNKSMNFFPNNLPYSFKSHMMGPLILEGLWNVAVVDTEISSSISKSESIYLYSSICGESIIDGEQRPLLRRLKSNTPGQWSTVVQSPFYMPVKLREIYDIDINITDELDKPASFIDRPSTVTLHFKAFPFY